MDGILKRRESNQLSETERNLLNNLGFGIKTDSDIDQALQSFRDQLIQESKQSSQIVLNMDFNQMSRLLKEKLQERRGSSPLMQPSALKIPKLEKIGYLNKYGKIRKQSLGDNQSVRMQDDTGSSPMAQLKSANFSVQSYDS